jgi:hypothetical protein
VVAPGVALMSYVNVFDNTSTYRSSGAQKSGCQISILYSIVHFEAFEQTLRLRLVSGPAHNYIIYIIVTNCKHLLCKKFYIAQKINPSRFAKQIRWQYFAKLAMQPLAHNLMPH